MRVCACTDELARRCVYRHARYGGHWPREVSGNASSRVPAATETESGDTSSLSLPWTAEPDDLAQDRKLGKHSQSNGQKAKPS